MIRVLVVDDSTFVRKAIRRVLIGDPDIELVGEADSGRMALELIAKLDPHVVTLDVEMPGLDGLSTLVEIMSQFPRPVLMMSLHTKQGAELTARCLEQGAVDCLDKSAYGTMDYHVLAAELKEKIRAAGLSRKLAVQRSQRGPVVEPEPAPLPSLAVEAVRRRGLRLVVFGASTGGPPVLQSIVSSLPKGFPVPILVVQHMPRGFTHSFAQRLDTICAVEVSEAIAGDVLRPGRVLIAPAGKHLRVVLAARELKVQLSRNPAAAAHIPSIDETMASAAEVAGADGLGVLLTGMGCDGALGLEAMRQAGALTVVQQPDSCVAFGMPRAALERGAANRSLEPAQITALLLALGS